MTKVLVFATHRPRVRVPMLREFVQEHREEILARARLRVAARNAPRATEVELTAGLPLFLNQLGEALRRASSDEALDHAEIEESAGQHGRVLFEHGLTVAQVVHDYGDLCQVITGLAVEHHATLDADEFRTLNLCLDDAIAGAVTAYSRLRERTIADDGTERLGLLAHEMRNVVNTSILTFGSIQKGTVSPGGSTGVVHARSLQRLIGLIDRSLSDVRLDSGMQNVERVAVHEIFEEVEIGAAMVARERGLQFEVMAVDSSVIVSADRQILAAAIANLVQNALKFTKPVTTVRLGATTTTDRVLISVEDECGGLPPGQVEDLLKPFTQRGHDRGGLGLGLAICVKAAKAMGGELLIRDLPGKGCIFTLDLPKQPPPPTSIFDHPRKAKADSGGASGAALRERSSSAVSLVDNEAACARVPRINTA
jgi:signal transduction histidine kinase